jgi:GR25 family glycosyltransferase involved in LPS biosynthesis
MICEDDLLFSKNAKDALQECEKNLNEIDWQLFHLGPTLHKPLLHVYKNLLDLTHASVTTDKLRGILGTTA